MSSITGRSSIGESYNTHMNSAASKNETLSRFPRIPAPISHLVGETISSTSASHLSPYRCSSNSPINNVFPARQLPPELRFTPVNSTAENSEPTKLKRATNYFSSEASGYPASNCRLIGFTPLVEEDITSSDDDSMQFLGPRKVQAKEVAPCALFYKRADVFVSSEMKSQNVLTFCESHYCKIQFDNEVSVKELEYAHQHSDPSADVSEPPMKINDLRHKKSSREDRFGLKINIKPSSVEEPVCQTSAKSSLTSMPFASEIEPGNEFNGKPLHIYTEETDSPLIGVNKVEQNIPWPTGYSYDVVSDPEQSTSNIGSSGIQSNLWDSVIASSTRATSPVSSIYSGISSSCQHQPLSTMATRNQFTQSHCKLTKFSLFKLNTEKESEKNFPSQALFDWREDNGSMADDENDSENSSIQLESDED